MLGGSEFGRAVGEGKGEENMVAAAVVEGQAPVVFNCLMAPKPGVSVTFAEQSCQMRLAGDRRRGR